MAVDRGAEPQTVRVISAPLILDGPGRPGAGRSSSRCCAVMVVTRLKDAAAAVSRICGHGSPIPISTQVRGILMIVMHRWAAADGSAHGRAFTAVESHPPDPDRPHGGHSSLTARARCAQRSPAPSSPPLPGPPPTRPGTFRATGCVSFRAGAFDAVGDSNPVPERVTCPRPHRNVPARAGCPQPRRPSVGHPWHPEPLVRQLHQHRPPTTTSGPRTGARSGQAGEGAASSRGGEAAARGVRVPDPHRSGWLTPIPAARRVRRGPPGAPGYGHRPAPAHCAGGP